MGEVAAKTTEGKQHGGVALKKTLVDELRFAPQGDEDALLVSVGNFLYPGALGVLDKGEMIVTCYNTIGYNVAAVGSLDLSLGISTIRTRAKQADFPLIATNLVWKGKVFSSSWFEKMVASLIENISADKDVVVPSPFPGDSAPCPLMPLAMFKTGGDITAVISFIDPPRRDSSNSGFRSIEVLEPVKIMKEAVMLLKDSGVTNVVVLTSSKLDSVLKMVATDGVSLVLSVVSPSSGELLKSMAELRTRNGARLCFISHGGDEVGLVKIVKDKSEGKDDEDLLSEPSQFYAVDETRKPDPELSAMVEQYEFQQTSQYSSRITTLSLEAAALFPELCCEIVREKINCDVGLLWHAIFRSRVNEGLVTELDLWRVLPMGETISRVSMRGSLLQKIVRENQDVLFTAGIKLDNGVWSINGRQIQSSAIYSVAMNQYLANGGEGYIDSSSPFVSRVKHFGYVINSLVKNYLLTATEPSLADFRYLWRKPVYIRNFTLSASFDNININDEVPKYADEAVPGMSDSGQKKFKSQWAGSWTQQRPRSQLKLSFRGKYDVDDGERDSDIFIWDIRYEKIPVDLLSPRLYVKNEVETTVSSRSLSGEDRAYKIRFGAGYSFQISDYFKVFAGVSNQGFAGSFDRGSNTGPDITTSYKRQWPSKGVSATSDINYYFAMSGTEFYQMRWENHFRLKLVKKLSLHINYDLLLYKDAHIGGTARDQDLFIGVGYEMVGRRF